MEKATFAAGCPASMFATQSSGGALTSYARRSAYFGSAPHQVSDSASGTVVTLVKDADMQRDCPRLVTSITHLSV